MLDWSKTTTAFVFPGQGSQFVGMGADVAAAYPAARVIFEQADDLLQTHFSNLCFNGPEDELNDTINTQPALYVCSMALLRVLQTELQEAQPIALAGHSLGELTALTAAGSLSFEDGLRLVRERGRLMKQAGETSPGAMAALLGLDAAKVMEVCQQAQQQTGGNVVLANDNCPGQVVISGEVVALEAAMELAKTAGAKRAVKLAVSVAAHSPLMASASSEFQQAIAATTLHPLRIPVYGNVSAGPLDSLETIREELNNQLTQNVRWTESVQAMIVSGITHFVEIGSKDVLTGLLKRIDRNATGIAVNNLDSLRAFLTA
ncbi:MAG TPA: ACP S-malonyltransferase [Phototrophicaceae bacterium]|jgi:[acyl-carrier-protein] S-malonyltransferase|nr:ACP S-malonyltransferase [Phototrophicaceae bacterium]